MASTAGRPNGQIFHPTFEGRSQELHLVRVRAAYAALEMNRVVAKAAGVPRGP